MREEGSSSLRGSAPGVGRAEVLGMLAAIFGGLFASLVLVHGSLEMILLLPGLLLFGLACVYPRLILWLIVVITVCLPETYYGVEDQSAFRLWAHMLQPIRLNIYEILVYTLFAILLVRRLTHDHKVVLPKSVAIPSVVLVCVYALQLGIGLATGTPYEEAFHRWNGEYVPLGVVTLWCCIQLLHTPKIRLRLLDVLFVLATGRAVYALVRYFFGSGDEADVYRSLGVKVALWESADHMLFVLLIVAAVAGWATQRLTRTRVYLWTPASILMAVTIVLSFRRTGWLGLVAALVVATFFLVRRSKRGFLLIPAILAATAGFLSVSYRRFAGSGSLLARLFPDLTAQVGVTRQDEWALAWQTIARNPVVGDIAARRGGASFAFWDTRIVHNAFLFTWMKFGLLGLLALSSLVLACGRYALLGVRSRCPEDYVALAVVGISPFVAMLTMTGGPLIELRMIIVLALAGSLGVGVGMRGANK